MNGKNDTPKEVKKIADMDLYLHTQKLAAAVVAGMKAASYVETRRMELRRKLQGK